jgi:hypothetical protein
MDGKHRRLIYGLVISLLPVSLVGLLLAYGFSERSPANLPEQGLPAVGETVKLPPWVPELADCVEIQIETPQGWWLSIYPNGDFSLQYGHGNVPEVAGFGGPLRETLDFAAIHGRLAAFTAKEGNCREQYAVAFHRRNVNSTTSVYTDDEVFIVRLFNKAKTARADRAGEAKLWADHPRTLPRKPR